MNSATGTVKTGFQGPSKKGGTLGWVLQRVTGLFLLYALAVHLWAVHVVAGGDLTWATITERLSNQADWTIYYLLFIPAVVYHGAIGLWAIALDFAPNHTVRRAIGLGLWAGGLGLVAYGYFGIQPLL